MACDTIRRRRSWSTLVKVMVCRLFGANPLPETILTYCYLEPQEKKLQWNLKQNIKRFNQQNTLENIVCKMSDILFRPESVNKSIILHKMWISISLKSAAHGVRAGPHCGIRMRETVHTGAGLGAESREHFFGLFIRFLSSTMMKWAKDFWPSQDKAFTSNLMQVVKHHSRSILGTFKY